MLAIIITDEILIARSFINVVFISTGDRVKVQMGNQSSKLGKKLKVHTCYYLIVQTISQWIKDTCNAIKCRCSNMHPRHWEEQQSLFDVFHRHQG